MTTQHPFLQFARKNEDILEDVMHDVYKDYLKSEQHFSIIDGGAHKGLHTYSFAALSGCDMVYAVEANQDLARNLARESAPLSGYRPRAPRRTAWRSIRTGRPRRGSPS